MHLVRTILASTEDVWKARFQALGRAYEEPKLVLFQDRVISECGAATSAVGPFYCPKDGRVYLDLDFFRDMQERHHAPGDFARAYIIAHEVGHHVQKLLGTMDRVRDLQKNAGKEEADRLQARLELQADFLAGLWAHDADKLRRVLEPGDVEAARVAIKALGDAPRDPDGANAQSRAQPGCRRGNHATAQERLRWFDQGLQTGDLAKGDTFAGGP